MENIKFNPLFLIWTQPRNTIEYITSSYPAYYVLLIVVAYCVIVGSSCLVFISYNTSDNAADFLPFIPLYGIAFVYLYALLIKGIGMLLKGKASYKALCAALAWPLMISLWSSPFVLPQFIINFAGSVSRDINDSVELVFLIPFLFLNIWTFVVMIQCISQVQKFSVVKAFLNISIVPIGIAAVAAMVFYRSIV